MVGYLRFAFIAERDEEDPQMWNGRMPGVGGQSTGYCTYSDSLEGLLERAVELADIWVTWCWENSQEPTQGPVGSGCVYQVSPSLRVQAAWMIRALRIEKGFTQEVAASRVGMSQTAYARLENPRKSNATMATLDRIARAFGQVVRVESVAV